MIISIDTEKVLDKTQRIHDLKKTKPQQSRNGRELPQPDKVHL